MVAKRIVACLDVAAGRVVKGIRFKNLRDAGDPVLNALRYCRDGVDELVMLDVSATQEARSASLETVARMAEAIDVPLTVGGGVRSGEDVARYLEAGADRVAINSAVLAEPSLIDRCAPALRRTMYRSLYRCDTSRRRSPHRNARRLPTPPARRTRLGARRREARRRRGLADVDRSRWNAQWLRSRFDRVVRLRTSRAVCRLRRRARAECFADALRAGADAALGASLFHDGDCRISDVKRVCLEQGLVIRP